MKMSDNGRALLIEREGFKTKAYRDSVGVLTIGVGHTSAAGAPHVTPGLTLTKEEVSRILARDLVQYEQAVEHAVTVPLSQGQFDALVSFCFNIGVTGFRKSTVVKRLNVGNYRGAADALMMWVKPKEIAGRRKSERAQFLAATVTAGAHVDPSLREGARGKAVEALQKLLNAAGASPTLKVDGDFGSKTWTAVKAYQATHALIADGVVGPKTWAALRGPVTFASRFFDAGDLHDGESVTADYLRAAGSRTIGGTDFLKKAAGLVVGADVAGAVAQAQGAFEQAQEALEGLQRGAAMLEVAKDYWPLAAGLGLTVVIFVVAVCAWRAAHSIERARIEDAVRS